MQFRTWNRSGEKPEITKPVICQNCGQKLPEYAHEALCAAIESLEWLPDHTSDGGVIHNHEGFMFAVHVDPPMEWPWEE